MTFFLLLYILTYTQSATMFNSFHTTNKVSSLSSFNQTIFDHFPLQYIPFDILPFDIFPFDIFPFDIFPFDIFFDQITANRKTPRGFVPLRLFCRDIEFSRYIQKGTELENHRFQRVVQYSSENISKLRASLVQSILHLVLGHISSVSPLWAVHRVTDDL